VLSSTRGAARHALFRVRASDGGGARRLASPQGGRLMPDFSPDGRRIAFVGYPRGGNSAIYVMNATGGGIREVVRHPGREVAFPRFSPDGRSLLYSTFIAGETIDEYRLRTVRVDGTEPVVLGPGAEADW
jgi:TolB protein